MACHGRVQLMIHSRWTHSRLLSLYCPSHLLLRYFPACLNIPPSPDSTIQSRDLADDLTIVTWNNGSATYMRTFGRHDHRSPIQTLNDVYSASKPGR